MGMRNEQPSPSAVLTGVEVNPAAATDFFIPVSCNKFIVRRVHMYDASTSLGAGSAQVALYLGAAAGGTNIVAAAVVTGPDRGDQVLGSFPCGYERLPEALRRACRAGRFWHLLPRDRGQWFGRNVFRGRRAGITRLRE